MKILVTGGSGYIGSHTVLSLIEGGHDIVVIDSLCNSTEESLRRIRGLTKSSLTFIEGDIRDTDLLIKTLTKHDIEFVVHFAGLKAVGQSCVEPLTYYENNFVGTASLCRAMSMASVFNLIFSSSATVYGNPTSLPMHEGHPLLPTSPYGRTKLMIEMMLADIASADPRWSIGMLRYFNPVGAHESGEIGEDPNGVPNNLLPYISQVAAGRRSELLIFGNDYSTIDGTGIRDYIHVMDLADGHIRALEFLKSFHGVAAWNLGTGQGFSVMQVLRAFEEVSGLSIPYRFAPRRPGDIAACYADSSKAQQELCWKPKRDLHQMMRDAWRWQSKNPIGFKS